MKTEWVDILKQAKWPIDVLVLDFETYFDADYSLRKMSNIEFLNDPRFEVLGVASLIVQGHSPFSPIRAVFWHDVTQHLRFLKHRYGDNLERCTVVAQNARFDLSVLAWHYGIWPPYVVDTLGLARHLNPRQKNDLATLAKRFDLPAKGDTDQFKGRRWEERVGPPIRARACGMVNRVFTRKKIKVPEVRWINEGAYQIIECPGMDWEMQTALSQYAKNDAEIELQVFTILLPQLSRPELELRVMHHTLELYTRPCIAVDFEASTRLAKAMTEKIDEAATSVGATPKILGSERPFKALLQEELGSEPVPMKKGKIKMLLAVAKGDEGREYLENHPNKRVQALMAARIAIKSWPLHVARVLRIAAQARANGGMLPVPLRYCGAHTGRFSGDEKINLQNMGKRSTEPMIREVRQLLIAPPGYRLICTDAAQIEARGLAWIAGQWDLIDAFANGTPIYCNFASDVLGRRIRKPRKDDPPPVAAYFKKQRSLGKVGVLGCGYGMGGKHCRIMAKAQYQLDLDDDTAARIVKYYRSINPYITRFWRDVEYAFVYVTKYQNEKRTLARGLTFYNKNDCTIIVLPCGRKLHYPKARVSPTDRRREQIWWPDSMKPGHIVYAWGGLLTENIVQALSRDILAESIFISESMGRHIGLRIGLHVHDEMIGVVAEEHAEEALEIQLTALRTRPEWAKQLPLDAEGSITERYSA